VRKKLDAGRVKDYAAALQRGAVFPPVQVVLVDGSPILVDGWHRVAAHERAGREEVTAQITSGTREAALAAAGLANLRHGLPLKKREVRRAFALLIRGRGHLSARGRRIPLRDLVDRLGGHASLSTVHRWLQKDHPRVAVLYRSARDDDRRAVSPNAPGPEPEAARAKETMAHLQRAQANLRGIKDRQRRAELLKALQEIVREARKGASKWKVPEESPDF